MIEVLIIITIKAINYDDDDNNNNDSDIYIYIYICKLQLFVSIIQMILVHFSNEACTHIQKHYSQL